MLYGAAHTSTDGHVDPTGATNALVKAAQGMGAEVRRHCPVGALRQQNGSWTRDTSKGQITAQHVVFATSFRAREMLVPLGVNVPVFPTRHHEIITEALPQIAAPDIELPAMRDSHVSCNVRQERDGLLGGIHEKSPEFWGLEGIPPDFKEELLPPNIEPLLPHLDLLMKRLPIFAEAGIKIVNNGPMCLTPDGLPLLGPVPNLDGLWLATGFNVGIGTGGGAAEFLATCMTRGAAPAGLEAVHADRFPKDMTQDQALMSIRAVYTRGYQLPDEIWGHDPRACVRKLCHRSKVHK